MDTNVGPGDQEQSIEVGVGFINIFNDRIKYGVESDFGASFTCPQEDFVRNNCGFAGI